jgi:hypothetical protein
MRMLSSATLKEPQGQALSAAQEAGAGGRLLHLEQGEDSGFVGFL